MQYIYLSYTCIYVFIYVYLYVKLMHVFGVVQVLLYTCVLQWMCV